ncbi:MAG: AraC family transcriptional regulator [Bacteroidales bacterium]|jgi:AraC-like DNA-binding protein
MIFIAGITVSFFLSCLLVLKKNKTKADLVLMVWLLVNALHQLLFYFDISGFSSAYPFWAALNIPFPFLHGPLLFLYIITFMNRPHRYRFLYVLHFLPFILSYLYFLPFYLSPADQKVFNVENGLADFAEKIRMNYFAVLASGFFYVSLSVVYLKKYRKQFQDKNIKALKISRRWLQFLILGIAIVWMAVLLGDLKQIFVIVMANTVLIGFVGIRSTPFFTNHTEFARTGPDNSRTMPVRYRKSGLTSRKRQEIREKLGKLMNEDKAFRDCGLTLDKLALQLHIHPNYLSQYINEELNMSFYDYINQYRTEEFKQLVTVPENRRLKFLALAYECGYNSKSSFNRNFKKVTGFTPSEYLRQTGSPGQ